METWRNRREEALKVLPLFHKNKEIIIFDTETTGLNPEKHQIIQFSAIKYAIQDDLSLTPVSMMDQYINPGIPLPEKIVSLTGITDNLLSNYMGEDTYAGEIYEFLDSCQLWAAFNIHFDINMLAAMADRLQYPFFQPDIIDVLRMARDCVPWETLGKDGNYKLRSLTDCLIPENDFQYHSAIEDVKATGKILEIFLQQYMDFAKKEECKTQVHLEWASYWENPQQKSMKRIKVNIDKDKSRYGWIYWDVMKNCWSCQKNKKAMDLFNNIDLANLEHQVLRKYGLKYQAKTMEDLAKSWGKVKRQTQATLKKAE